MDITVTGTASFLWRGAIDRAVWLAQKEGQEASIEWGPGWFMQAFRITGSEAAVRRICRECGQEEKLNGWLAMRAQREFKPDYLQSLTPRC